MANSPNFIAKQGVKVSTSGTLEYTPQEDAKLYHAYCKGSTAATEATLEVSSSDSENISPVTMQASYNWGSYGLINDDDTTGQVNQGFGHIIYEKINSVSITLPGTFPLAQDTSFVVSVNLGNTALNTQVSATSGDTVDEVAYKIYRQIYNNYLISKQWNEPTLNFTFTRNSSQQVITSSLSIGDNNKDTPDEINLQLGAVKPAYILTAVSGNTVTISQDVITIQGKDIPENPEYTTLNQVSIASYNTSGVELDSRIGTFNRDRTLNAVNSTYSEFNGEVGSSADPFNLFSDAKNQLEGLIVDGSVLEGTLKTATITAIKAVITGGTLPIVSNHAFTGTGENIDLISDAGTNPVFLTDVHGNKYLPLEKGQKIKVTAPADNIVLVYGEE